MLRQERVQMTAPVDKVWSPAGAAWVWPTWAKRARIAGAYFDLGETDAEIRARLDVLAAQHVSVVVADSPWGQQYAVWVDDDRFRPVRDLVSRVVLLAHTRGLRIVLYQTGLELESDASRDPGSEHPEWAQRSLDGRPVLFADVTREQQHWLDEGIWDFWVSPCTGGPGSFAELSRSRVREMAATGIDGLWVDEAYLQSSVGSHHDLWPSADPCSAEAFRAATGLALPAAADQGDPVFRRWVVWRHSQISDFLQAEKAAAREINPEIVFFNENSDLDLGRSTYVANDPAAMLAYPDMGTGHEVDTIGDRMDQGETGMKFATLDQWLAFRTMLAFGRGADRGKPSWILTYGYEPRDSAQLAGMVLAERGNFYETKGPQMAHTAGGDHRAQLFAWIAAHEDAIYEGESAAEVALLYSPRTRDLVDPVAGDAYDPADTVHFAAYRAAGRLLYRRHIPFDVVIDTDTVSFARYRALVVPEVRAMSDETLAALRQFGGIVITVGKSGVCDGWLKRRSMPALAGVSRNAGHPRVEHFAHFRRVRERIAELADTGLLATDAPAEVQVGLRRDAAGYSLVIVNAAAAPAPAFRINLRLLPGAALLAAQLSTPATAEIEVGFSQVDNGDVVKVDVPTGIDPVALLRLEVAQA